MASRAIPTPAPPPQQRLWLGAAGSAAAAHLLVAALVLAWTRAPVPPPAEPVVLVELPPLPAAPADPALPLAAATLPQPAHAAQPASSPIQAPPVAAPVPADAVPAAPPAPVQRAVAAPVAAAVPAPVTAAPAPPAAALASAGAGDPRARKQEADYFALVSAHLNRRKVYPAEARQARQQGVVTVRFTVDRAGNVSAASIKRSSGHGVLDQATLALLQRVAPLPRMPAAMARDTVTLSLPIDYSLRTN